MIFYNIIRPPTGKDVFMVATEIKHILTLNIGRDDASGILCGRTRV